MPEQPAACDCDCHASPRLGNEFCVACRCDAAASVSRYQVIDFTPEDGRAVYRVLLAARSIEGVMFTHEEWDHAMSAFGRLSLLASMKGVAA